MAWEPHAQLFKERLDVDPYRDKQFLADIVSQSPNLGRSDALGDWRLLYEFGKDVWRLSRMALDFWSPKRVEEEAYRRAGNDPSVSKISEEVARFHVLYAKWVEQTQEVLQYANHIVLPVIERQSSFMRESIAETLIALERRAQAAEQRATDLRIRYEFDRLRAVVTGRAMASEVASLIEDAIKNSGMERAVFERFAPQIARLEKDIEETKLDTRFIADLAGEEFMKKQLPAKRVASAAEKLVELVPYGKALSAILRLLVKS
jgi:hypothetical protein